MSDLVVDNRTKFEMVLTDQDGVVFNLTGASVNFRYSIDGAVVVIVPATIEDAGAGIASYTMGVGELTRGEMRYEWEVTDAGGLVHISSEVFEADVRNKIGAV